MWWWWQCGFCGSVGLGWWCWGGLPLFFIAIPLQLLSWVGLQSWVSFGHALVDFSIGFATMGNGFADWHGGMARWRSAWWVSRLARSAVVGFQIDEIGGGVVGKIDSFFFLSLGDYVVVVSCGCGCCCWFLEASLFFFSLWWLFLVVVVGGGFGGLSCGFVQIGGGFGDLSDGFGDFCGGFLVVFGRLCLFVFFFFFSPLSWWFLWWQFLLFVVINGGFASFSGGFARI